MSSPTSHPHGLHCLYFHGFHLHRWCIECRRSFEQFEGVEGEPRPPAESDLPEVYEAWKSLFRKYVDAVLAYAVLAEIERGELPCPPSFDGLIIEKTCVYPSEPSLS
jgi:hypothetical protein